MFRTFLLCLLISFIGLSSSESQFTVNIDPGDERCFYAPAETGEKLVIQYNVVQKGDEAESRINFYLTTASGAIVASDLERSRNFHSFIAEEDGDFKACFGNFLTYSIKQVFFTTSVGNRSGSDWNRQDIVFEATESSNEYDFKLFDIEHLINQMGVRLYQARQQQRQLRLLEARDRSVAEANLQTVNRWSLLQMAVMVAVLAVQVLMVRSFFCDPVPRASRRWRWK